MKISIIILTTNRSSGTGDPQACELTESDNAPMRVECFASDNMSKAERKLSYE